MSGGVLYPSHCLHKDTGPHHHTGFASGMVSGHKTFEFVKWQKVLINRMASTGLELFEVKMLLTAGLVFDVGLIRPSSREYIM